MKKQKSHGIVRHVAVSSIGAVGLGAVVLSGGTLIPIVAGAGATGNTVDVALCNCFESNHNSF